MGVALHFPDEALALAKDAERRREGAPRCDALCERGQGVGGALRVLRVQRGAVDAAAGDVVEVVCGVLDVGVGLVGEPGAVDAERDDDEAAGELRDGDVGLDVVADPLAGYGDGEGRVEGGGGVEGVPAGEEAGAEGEDGGVLCGH